MKKVSLIIAAVLFAAVSLQARPTGFTIGGGFGFQRFYMADAATDHMNLYGMYVDLAYSKDFTKNHTLYVGGRINMGFDSKSYVGEVGGGVARGTAMILCFNLDIPVYYQYNVVINPACKFFIEAGPTFNFWPIATEYYFLEKGSAQARDSQDIFAESNNIRRANIYIGGNFGFKVHDHVRIYAGGDYGLIKPFKTDANNNVFTTRIGAAYIF